MTTTADEMSVDVPCHACGYDLRAQPPDGACPECGASVEESRRIAAIPLRPAWRDSDPRWRRRMLAGAWILVLLPLVDAMKAFELAEHVRVPGLFTGRDPLRTLDRTFAAGMNVYPTIVFCIGVVLLFSRERGRRRIRSDWTRRWGVVCSYAVLLLGLAPATFITALVMVGISAQLHSIPLAQQPAMTPTFADVSYHYVRYGPQAGDFAVVLLLGFSSVAMLFACVALYDAIRSTAPQRVTLLVLVPLMLIVWAAAFYLAHVARYCIQYPNASPGPFSHGIFFWPELAARQAAGLPDSQNTPGAVLSSPWLEVAKWCVMLLVAVWLSVAQVLAWRRGRTEGNIKLQNPI